MCIFAVPLEVLSRYNCRFAEITLLEPDPVSTGGGKRKISHSSNSLPLFLSCILFSRSPTPYQVSLYYGFSMIRFLLLFFIIIANAFSVYAQLAATSKKFQKQSDTLHAYKTPSITVTSTRASERETPTSFTEISGADIRRQQTVQDLPALLGELPSMIFYSDNGNNIGYTTLTMRGFDQRRIAVLVNGVPQNDPEDHNVYWIDFPDMASNLQSVQVQRGAGMANYGAAAIGGSINLTTANFANANFMRFSSGVSLQQYDDVNSQLIPNASRISFETSSGLVGKYAMYARLSRISSDGYRYHSQAELNSYFLSAVRFDSNVTTQITVYGGPFSDGLAYNGLPKSAIYDPAARRENYSYFDYNSDSLSNGKEVLNYTIKRRSQEIENFSQPHYEILNDATLSSNLTLKSTLFYYSGSGYYDFDGSWADSSTLRLTSHYGFHSIENPRNAIIRAYVDNNQGGWIPRIVLKHDAGETTVGAEIRLHRSYHYGQIPYSEILPDNYDVNYKIYEYNGKRNIYSLFLREQYDISSDLRLTGEMQVVHHRYAIDNEKAGGIYTTYMNIAGKEIGNGQELFAINYTFLNPRLGINWNPNENISGYAALAATSREPRMRNLYAAEDAYFGALPLFKSYINNGITIYDFSSPLIKPEKLINLEAGAAFKNDKFHVKLGLYWMEFTDEFVKNGKLDIFGVPVDGNAKRSRHIGAELEASAIIYVGNSGSLTVSGNTAISHNRFVDYNYFTNDGTVISLKNNQIAGFPDVLTNMRAEYAYGILRGGFTLRHIGMMYTDNFGAKLRILRSINPSIADYLDNTIPAATVVNFSAAIEMQNIIELRRLRLYCTVNNAGNLLYAAGGVGKEFFPAAGRSVYLGVEAEL